MIESIFVFMLAVLMMTISIYLIKGMFVLFSTDEDKEYMRKNKKIRAIKFPAAVLGTMFVFSVLFIVSLVAVDRLSPKNLNSLTWASQKVISYITEKR